ncbi:hypothetical protein [Geoalkalibacter sp.]|uniref:hypothetical protein n=1 Tax=Geoalkalibacter sp. TaxID=3041440 RepID=UPI00272E53B0|nr:hypothetical protein [Geoalkalibacter sp.]
MKSRLSLLFAALLVFSLPLGAGAMSHSKHEGHGTHKTEKTEKKSKHQHHEEADAKKTSAAEAHAHMAAHGDMFDLGSGSDKGVKASAHLDDVAEEMAKAGMPHTHHLMVLFLDEKSGEPIEEGTVAVKIRNPAGEESAPLRLVGMDGHFGADLTIDQKGVYVFTVGTSLIDGVKRQYEFKYENE